MATVVVANAGDSSLTAFNDVTRATQTAHLVAGTGAASVAVDQATRIALVALTGSSALGEYGLPALTGLTSVPTGGTPVAVAVGPGEQVAVVCNDAEFGSSNGSITVIDLVGGSAPRTIGVLTEPTCVAIDPTGRMACIGYGSDAFTIVDLATSAVSTWQSLLPGPGCYGLALTSDGSTAFASTTGGWIAKITGLNPQNPSAASAQNPTGSNPAIAHDGKLNVSAHFYGVVLTPDGSVLYTCNVTANTVVPITGLMNGPLSVGTGIPVGGEPTAIAMASNGSALFVANSVDATVSKIALPLQGTPPFPTYPVGQQPRGLALLNDFQPTLTLTPSASSTIAGSSIQFTAILKGLGLLATDVVTFTQAVQNPDGSWGPVTNLPPAPNPQHSPDGSTLTAVLTVPFSDAGTYQIGAQFGGDASNYAAAALPVTVTVNKHTTTVTLVASATAVTVRGSVTFTATTTGEGLSASDAPTVTQATWQGTSWGTAVILPPQSAPVVSADHTTVTATLTVPYDQVGQFEIVAGFGGDADNTAAQSAPITVKVSAYPATVTLVASATAVVIPGSVTFTATTTGENLAASDAPTLTQATWQGTAWGAAVTIPPQNAPVVSADQTTVTATLTVPFDQAGQYQITAGFGGDADNTAAQSAPITVTAGKDPATVTLVATTNTTVTVPGTVTFTATVTGEDLAASDAPTFTQATWQGTAWGAAVTLPLQNAPVVSANSTTVTATLTVPFDQAGQYQLTAGFGGDADNTAAQSAPITVTASKAQPTLTLVPPGSTITPGKSVPATATLTGVELSTADAIHFSRSTLEGGSWSSATPLPVALHPHLSADHKTLTVTESVPFLDAGTYRIEAQFDGDANNLGVAATPIVVTVEQFQPTLTLVASANPTAAADTVVYTATLTGVDLSAADVIMFSEQVWQPFVPKNQPQNQHLGNWVPVPLTATPSGPVVSSDGTTLTTTLSLPFPNAGSYQIEAQFGGDTNNLSASASPVFETVATFASSIAVRSSSNPSTVSHAAENQQIQVGITYTVTVDCTDNQGMVTLVDNFYSPAKTILSEALNGRSQLQSVNVILESSDVGAHQLQAHYWGDANNTQARAPFTEQVEPFISHAPPWVPDGPVVPHR